MPKEGTTETTTTEYVKEDGKRIKKTIITTTTVTKTADGGYKTKINTSTKKQEVGSDDDSDSGAKGGKSKLSDKMKKLNVSDSDDDKKHDGKNDMSNSNTKEFRSDLLIKINQFRRKHQATGLKADSNIDKVAQEHADKMLKKDKISLHSGNYGQTLAMKLPRPSGNSIAEMWYKGKDEYDFKRGEFSRESGNFTQMIWGGSKSVGIGVASNKDGKTYIVALYDPAGNVQNHFKDNVKKEK
uniref:Golgi-associated plant pathogenesis-related protein 1-like n=1 Tax=Styela clava TaxID=7725 RepID=UPI00193A190E|nr:Golgi-associated plant pathogenesis-related protein 1-like [Styela clava]